MGRIEGLRNQGESEMRLSRNHCLMGLLLLSGLWETSILGQMTLADPIPIWVNDSILDVEHEGDASPAVIDIDGDGIRDLVVGESYQGQLRIYRNLDSNESPRFQSFGIFKNGESEGRLPSEWSFHPSVVDLDGDGLPDIITPAWFGGIFFFRQTSPGVFAKGVPLRNVEGKVIWTEEIFGATTCDWDNDGFTDVVCSIGKSNLWLLRNSGVQTEPRFENPVAIKLGHSNLSATAPVAVDWNRDGLFDFIVGTREGAVLLYLNSGQLGKPMLTEGSKLIDEPEVGSQRGRNARPCVLDWNGDGRLDILVGDGGLEFEKKLEPEEVSVKEETKRILDNSFSRWAVTYRLFHRLKQVAPPARNEEAIKAIRQEMMELTAERDRQRLRYQLMSEGKQIHGRVWLYLGE